MMLLLSFTFPVVFLVLQLINIGKICLRQEVCNDHKMYLTMLTNVEASIESCSQLLLQLFIIFYGYSPGLLQRLTILASLIQLAKCSIAYDIERNTKDLKKEMKLTALLIEFVKRLPCYSSTIVFRIMSICLTMAFLRKWSIIPLSLLSLYLNSSSTIMKETLGFVSIIC